MNAVTALKVLHEQGVEVLPEGENLRIIPKIPDSIRGVLVRLKPELIPLVRVLAALDYGPMKRNELMQETGLDVGEVYGALGTLYDAGLVKTDPLGWYYLPAQFTRPAPADRCPSCRDSEARGVRALACSGCDARVN